MLSAADVMRKLKVSRSYAYKLISRLNEEMGAAGNITIPGKVSESYLEQRLFTLPSTEGRSASSLLAAPAPSTCVRRLLRRLHRGR